MFEIAFLKQFEAEVAKQVRATATQPKFTGSYNNNNNSKDEKKACSHLIATPAGGIADVCPEGITVPERVLSDVQRKSFA